MQCDIKERIIRKQKTVKVECFKYGEKGHKCRECPLWKGEKKLRVVEKAMYVAMPQKAQQKEWRRLELEWYIKEVIVLYVKCKRCGRKGCHVEENREQEVISDRQKWCGCQKRKETEVVHPKKRKAQ